jgi:hypothetical protein
MGRWYIAGTNRHQYPAQLNQCHDKTNFSQIRTWSQLDDKNQAAVMVRGCNTSFNYNGGGRNFKEMEMGNPNGYDNFYPVTKWHQTTSMIRNEPVYTFAPRAGGFSTRKW